MGIEDGFGILDEESESSNEVDANAEAELTARVDPFAAALATRLAGAHPQVAKAMADFLHAQRTQVETQTEYLEEEITHEWPLQLAHLKNRSLEGTLRRTGMRVKLAFQVFVSLLALGATLGLSIMVYDAFHSRSVVIDAFEAPASMAADGYVGRVVAAGLLDRLTQLQAATRTVAEKRDISGAWNHEISLQLPEAGISLAILEQVLKNRFGHDTHISGELVRSGPNGQGLTITVRGTGMLPKTFTDPDGKLDTLLTQAGEYLYGESQPGLMARYLLDANRNDEVIAFAKQHLNRASVDDQAELLQFWGNAVTAKAGPHAMSEALALYQQEIKLKPEAWAGYNSAMLALYDLGHEEEAVTLGRQELKAAGGRPGKAPENFFQNYDNVIYDLGAVRASSLADIAATGSGLVTNQSGAEILLVAQYDVQLHETDTARLHLKTATWDEHSAADTAQASYTQALLAEETGDLEAAARFWDTLAQVFSNPLVYVENPSYLCWAAPTYEKTGQRAKAEAALASPATYLGIDTFTDCYRFRADVLALRGDWHGAETWYHKGEALGPSIPTTYYSYGLALVKHGDLAQAAEQFALAHDRGPHWADPLKAWGDLLAAQNKPEEARKKYEAALKLAPEWPALKAAIAAQRAPGQR